MRQQPLLLLPELLAAAMADGGSEVTSGGGTGRGGSPINPRFYSFEQILEGNFLEIQVVCESIKHSFVHIEYQTWIYIVLEMMKT